MHVGFERRICDSSHIILYSNQPVLEIGGRFYSPLKNFNDFLSAIAHVLKSARLVVPCRTATEDEVSGDLTEVHFSVALERADYYEGHAGAFQYAFRNVVKIRRLVRTLARDRNPVLVAGPGPNTFLVMLSFVLPSSVKYAFFIRGDTVETLRHIYRGRLMYPAVIGLARLYRRRIRALQRGGRAVVFAYGSQLAGQYRAPGNDARVIAPLIERDIIKEPPSRRGIRGELLRVLFVGRLSEEKNVEALVEACALSRKSGRPFKLRVVGFGPLRERLARKVREEGLSDWVELVGYRAHGPDLIREYDESDVLCLPSRTEGVPRAVLEALARGVAVVSTRVGSLPELFPEEIHFLQSAEPASIASGIRWISDNRDAAYGMTHSALTKIGQFVIEDNARDVAKDLKEFCMDGRVSEAGHCGEAD